MDSTYTFLAMSLMINELQYDATLYTTPPGFQLIGVYPGVSPLTRLHHRAILWRPKGLRIWLAALAVLGRDENGLRRGEECPLGLVKNLPAADGEEQLALS